jgi:Protein of unknown function (DUF3237)|nr:DUF3237 domain-containing protein [uncultured Limnohabitans sp.]
MSSFKTTVANCPRQAPTSVLAWEAVVNVGPRQGLGHSPAGERFIIPILGGTFEGADLTLRGRVLPGGADRQLLRPDGIKELDALYEMQTDDGTVLTIHNRVLIDAPAEGERYAFSHVKVTAAQGPHDWLNRRVFVGTLHPLPPERKAVLIRVWMLV